MLEKWSNFKNTRKGEIAIKVGLISSVFLGFFLFVSLFPIQIAAPSEGWWNTSWDYRKEIQIDSSYERNETDMQIKLNISHVSGKMQNNFNDARFVYYNATADTETEIDYWIQNKTDSSYADVWVKMPFLSNISNETIYLYYGNAGASSESNNTAVFTKEAVGKSAELYLVSRWAMDEGTGSYANDTMGVGNLTLIGNTAWNTTDGGYWDNRTDVNYSGSSLTFDANDDVAEANQDSLYDITGELTLTSWVYLNSYQSSNAIIVGKTDHDLGVPIAYHLAKLRHTYGDARKDKMTFTFYSNGGYRDYYTSEVMPLNRWVFCAATYNDADNEVKLYFDSELDVNHSMSYSLNTNTANVTVGGNSMSPIGEELDATIDEVRIYNATLSEFEIKAIHERRKYSAGTLDYSIGAEESQSEDNPPQIQFINPTETNGTTISANHTEANISISDSGFDSFKYNWNGTNYSFYDKDLVLLLNFNNYSAIGDSSSQATDNSQYGNNGTISGASWNSSGKYGSAMTFDGDGDYVDIGSDKSASYTFSDGGAWCWFGDPRAIHYNNSTYIGYVDTQGSIKIFKYNHLTENNSTYTLHSLLQYDDHANPSILLREDKKLMVFYSKHNGDEMYYRISTNAEDISSWGAEQTAGNDTMHTYSNPVYLSDENLTYLFYRHWLPYYITYNESAWSEYKVLFNVSGERPYVKVASNDKDEIHFAVTDGHPTSIVNNSIYYFYYKNNDFYLPNDSSILNTSSLPLVPDNVSMVYNASTTSERAWIWDIALDSSDNPYIVYAVVEDTSNHYYRYAWWNSTEWVNYNITNAGGYINGASQPYYSGGVVLDHSNVSIIYLSKEINGVFEIQKGVTSDSGATWTFTNITENSTKRNVRPFVIKNHTSDFNVLWMYGDYPGYSSYRTDIYSDKLGKITNFKDEGFTLSAWVKPTFTGEQRYIFANPNQYTLRADSTSKFRGSVWNGIDVVSTNTFEADKWYHVVFTYNTSSDTGRLYVNGEETGIADSGSTRGHVSGLTIGHRASKSEDWNGTLDEVRIYKRTLTSAEIQLHYQSEFQRYNSTDWGFYANVTELVDGTYTHYGWANDTTGNENSTDVRYLTISSGDTTNPTYSDNVTHPTSPATYSPNQDYQFNATWTDNIDISDVVLEFDGNNYTYLGSDLTKSGNIYYITFSDLGVANYNYKWYANDTSDNWNNTDQVTYEISRANPSIDLVTTCSEILPYESNCNQTGFVTTGDASATKKLYRSDVEVADGTPATEILVLPAGDTTYNYTYFQSENYSAKADTTITVTISAKSINLYLALNGTQDNRTYYYPDPINATAWKDTTLNDEGTQTLYRDGSDVGSLSENILLGNGTYAYKTNFSATNYTASDLTRYALVNKGATDITLLLNGTHGNRGYNTNQIANFTTYLNISGKTVYLDSNITGWVEQSGTTPLYNSTNLTTVGTYNITAYWSGDANYTGDSETFYASVTEIEDFENPLWRNQGQNISTIKWDEAVKLYAEGFDETALDWAWLATNETGAWENKTSVEITPTLTTITDYFTSFDSDRWGIWYKYADEHSIDSNRLRIDGHYNTNETFIYLKQKIYNNVSFIVYNYSSKISDEYTHPQGMMIVRNATNPMENYVYVGFVGDYQDVNFRNRWQVENTTHILYYYDVCTDASDYSFCQETRTTDEMKMIYNETGLEVYIDGTQVYSGKGYNETSFYVGFFGKGPGHNDVQTTTELFNDTQISYMGWVWSNFTWTNTSISANETIAWRIYYNDTSNNENVTDIMTFNVYESPPTYSDNSTNSTWAGQATELKLKWEDPKGLSGYTFSFDNGTGSFTNDTWQPMTGTENWTEVIKILNSVIGSTIRWKVYANDTNNYWNTSQTYSFDTTEAYFSITSTEYEDYVNETGTYNFSIIFAANPANIENITSYLIYNGTDKGIETYHYKNSTHIVNTKEMAIPLFQNNASTPDFYFYNVVDYVGGGQTTINSTTDNQTVLFLYYFPPDALTVTSSDQLLEGESFSTTLNLTSLSENADITANITCQDANHSMTADDYNNFSAAIDSGYITSGLNETFNITGTVGISFDGSERYMTAETENATVYKLLITDCSGGSGSTTKVLTFNLKNEENTTEDIVGTVDISMDVWKISDTKRNYSFGFSGSNTYDVCIYPTWAVMYTDAMVEYDSENTTKREYYLSNATISNSTSEIDLYLLEYAKSTQVIFSVKDETGTLAEGSIVKIQRYYTDTNTYLTVAMVKTDEDGKSATYLYVDEAFYKFIVEYENEIKTTTSPGKIIDADGDGIYSKELTWAGGLGELYDYIGKVGYLCNYNNDTRILRCSVSDTSGKMQETCIKIIEVGVAGTEEIYENCQESTATDLVYEFDNTTGKTYQYGLFIRFTTGAVYHLMTGIIETLSTPLYGSMGLLISFMILMVMAFAGTWNPTVSILLGITALIFSAIMGLFVVSTVSLVGIALVGVVLIYKMKA